MDLGDWRALELLAAKPFVYAFNGDEAELDDKALRERLAALGTPAESVFLDAKTEAELAEMPEDEAAELMAGLGLGEPGLAPLARPRLAALGPPPLPTAGPEETRAWTIPAGS